VKGVVEKNREKKRKRSAHDQTKRCGPPQKQKRKSKKRGKRRCGSQKERLIPRKRRRIASLGIK